MKAGHEGGGVAAPVGGQIFSEILPYLEVNQGNADEVEIKAEIETPDFTSLTLKEAEKIAKEKKIELVIENMQEGEEINKEQVTVVSQVPRPGITIKEGSKVYVTKWVTR